MRMLRVGLTGGLGSGKSAVSRVWAEEGVPILEADALGRALMQPGEPVYARIVQRFGPQVVDADGRLDRAALASAAFAGGGLADLNAIVHPAVIAAQQAEFARLEAVGTHPLAVVESALIFEASGDGPQDGVQDGPQEASDEPSDLPRRAATSVPGWRARFDRLVLVTAPEALRVERFVRRVAGPHATPAEQARLRADALRRIAAQLPDDWKRPRCDYIIDNDRTLVLLRRRALEVLRALQGDAATRSNR
jgi:dephospho-CoA kinase